MLDTMNSLDMFLTLPDEADVAAFLEAPMDMALFDSMMEAEEASDATSTVCSSPSSYCSDDSRSSASSSPVNHAKVGGGYGMYPWAATPLATAMPIVTDVNMIPYALPMQTMMPPMVQKRPLDADPIEPTTKRSKHEIRLMKNRESANKSRLRRKNQINDLASDVQVLTDERNALKTEVAALRAENQSLRDQNQFLRGLVSSGTNTNVQSAVTSLEEATPVVQQTSSKKLAAPVAGFVLCAFVFGMTLFSDPYGDSTVAAQRRSMRVVHGSAGPKTTHGFMMASPIGLLPFVTEYVYSNMGLIQSILINVISAMVVAAIYVYLVAPKTKPTESSPLHVKVNVDSKLKRLCSRATRLVVRGRNALNLTKLK
ncbi:hypothetical protein SPRG_06554 [Saprolegnia parasitica CBS 223.65]|uniref:BZIP domain-containing protein n=1 Tax=Saprolegnia parasitica (strain CBS 223.65) TaxID=695850 RepID=A0A067CHR9_SAPPC|nr:hypothetical protein SPRG_06554 [Saprolegnia parasitica CBS 223.65]KDO28700.1 hypothetical protein SPRG_06554 [Saprolegnia parasitica CBS 223.65]|eukprot:XP_012200758.1 hypothetical protein SPRG_06554 [Saprolegnia parasitica CBS 223.65]